MVHDLVKQEQAHGQKDRHVRSSRQRPPAQRPSLGVGCIMSSHRGLGAMPETCNAIRVGTSDDEPPAVVFHEQALPGALVSWAWCQLVALNSMLDAIIEARRGQLDGPDIAGGVQAVLVPVINALEFSEERAHQLRLGSAGTRGSRGRKRRNRRRSKAAEA